MEKGMTFPAAAPPADRSDFAREAREKHERAVAHLEAAQTRYAAAVNALPLPELMQGPVVRVTDADSIQKAETVLELTDLDEAEADRLIAELRDYRAERLRLAQIHAVAEFAEEVAEAAAAIPREEAWADALADYSAKVSASYALPDDHPDVDTSTDAYCEAMDALMNVPAPTPYDLALKIDLATTRAEGFVERVFAAHQPGILADFTRLTDIDPMRAMARAWVDRWVAVGGNFGMAYNQDGSVRGALRGCIEPSFWTMPSEHNPLLQPHQWIYKQEQQEGAKRMLDSLLTLVPGLETAVFDLAQAMGLLGTGGRRHAA